MIQPTFMKYKKYCHGMGTQQIQQLVNFIIEHLLTYCQYIYPIHPLQYIDYIFTLWYLIHEYLLMEKVILHHHHMTHQQKAWHLKVTLRHAKTYSIRYRMYQLARMYIRVCQICLCHPHLTFQTMSILKEEDVRKIIEINTGEKNILSLSRGVQIFHLS